MQQGERVSEKEICDRERKEGSSEREKVREGNQERDYLYKYCGSGMQYRYGQ